MSDLSLDTRTGLPDALRVLLAEHPREAWEAHPQFHGLVSFWLDRHMMFRRLLEALEAEAQGALDGNRDARRFAAALSQYGGMLVNNLHGHHQIEDHHYFPVLAARDARVARGFEILDADHHALDGILNGFVTTTNDAIQTLTTTGAVTDAAGAFHGDLTRLAGLLDRHLTDEEEVVVPVILKYGADGLG